VWFHGGGFFKGARSEITDVAREWAARGFVSVNADYRVDPGSQCMQLAAFSGAARAAATTRCSEAMDAAMHDAQAAVRWVRAHATELRVDPDRVAVGGFSAGALTATHVAQRADDPGSVGTNLDQSSTVAAALAASGCSAKVTTIDANDAPVFFLASEFDPQVPFSCTTATVDRLTQLGAAPATRFFMGENGHALALYRQHRAEVMAAWSAFLIHNLGLA
jgi:acetyl esterase/lipase